MKKTAQPNGLENTIKVTAQDLLQQGLSHHQEGRLDEAIREYQKSLEIQPGNATAHSNMGTALQAKNRLEEAMICYEKALAINPGYMKAYNNLGSVLKNRGNVAEAVVYFQKALVINPDYITAHCNLGSALQELGRGEEAVVCFQKALSIDPNYAPAHNSLGLSLKELGKIKEAVANYQKALSIKPDFQEAYSNLGDALKEQGKQEEAVASYQKALAIQPDYVNVLNNLGIVFKEQGELAHAMACYNKALVIDPNCFESHSNLGNALQEQGELDRAVVCHKKALAIKPDYITAHSNLGTTLQEQGKLDEAVASYQKALSLMNSPQTEPEKSIPNTPLSNRWDSVNIYSNMGTALQEQGKLDEAIASYHKALSINPNSVEAHSNLGTALKDQGRWDEAIASYQKALSIKPNYANARSNYLFVASYNALLPFTEMLNAHKTWDTIHGEPLTNKISPQQRDERGDRVLRIGYVSPDFRHHPVSIFLAKTIEYHNRSQVEVFCYSDVLRPDQLTKTLISHADCWHNIVGWSNQQLVEQVKQDKIDILIDLTGHTAKNRLLAFVHKPAPIQATYLGYCTTTGLKTMDYWITDPVLTPETTQEQAVETIVRLPKGWVNYYPLEQAPIELAPREFLDGPVFGSFNDLSKITNSVIEVWCEILHKVPNSRLLLKTNRLSNDKNRARISRLFSQYGITQNRLILKPRTSTYLAEYGHMDIALDPFPRTGGATTADALWMGVPVITLLGQRMIERQGASLLTTISKTEWIGTTVGEYVNKAVQIGKQGVRTTEQRLSLHESVICSPLCNYAGFVADLEAAYRKMWHTELSTRENKTMETKNRRVVLNVGGNNKNIALPNHYEGWDKILLDIDPTGKPDIVLDARKLSTLEGEKFDSVYCSHNLEHYFHHEAVTVLQGFHHVLKEDGFVMIQVPDMGEVMETVVRKKLDIDDVLTQSPSGPIMVRDVIYGYGIQIERSGQDFYAHKTGFTRKSLIKILRKSGFEPIFTAAGNLEVLAYAFKKLPTPYAKELLKLS
jgi:protein O-GlcNAc transferase